MLRAILCQMPWKYLEPQPSSHQIVGKTGSSFPTATPIDTSRAGPTRTVVPN